MRSHAGREPLAFAVDASVRQLLLAEVEKLRMGLLDELLAEEDDKAKGGKKGKAGKVVAGGEAHTDAAADGEAKKKGSPGKKAKKGFMTPERKKKLRVSDINIIRISPSNCKSNKR